MLIGVSKKRRYADKHFYFFFKKINYIPAFWETPVSEGKTPVCVLFFKNNKNTYRRFLEKTPICNIFFFKKINYIAAFS